MCAYLKSPINYTGNKFKLLPQIVPLFPKRIGTFVDVFGGSGTVLLNADADSYVYNEYADYVFSMFNGFATTDFDDIISGIYNVIEKYRLSIYNKDGYLKLRDDYNKNGGDWVTLYVLCCYAFNAQGRFGSNGKFNMPFGENRSYFSDVQKAGIYDMKIRFSGKDVKCTNLSFDCINYSVFGERDFVYFDPPYLGSVAVYNEKNGWTESQEQTLSDILRDLDSRGVRFAVSNNLKYGNPILEDICGRYNTFHLGSKYNNSSYHKTNKSDSDDEVLVVNYQIENNKTLF